MHATVFELWQVKYLNSIVEHDHRFIKRRLKPGLGLLVVVHLSRMARSVL